MYSLIGLPPTLIGVSAVCLLGFGAVRFAVNLWRAGQAEKSLDLLAGLLAMPQAVIWQRSSNSCGGSVTNTMSRTFT